MVAQGDDMLIGQLLLERGICPADNVSCLVPYYVLIISSILILGFLGEFGVPKIFRAYKSLVKEDVEKDFLISAEIVNNEFFIFVRHPSKIYPFIRNVQFGIVIYPDLDYLSELNDMELRNVYGNSIQIYRNEKIGRTTFPMKTFILNPKNGTYSIYTAEKYSKPEQYTFGYGERLFKVSVSGQRFFRREVKEKFLLVKNNKKNGFIPSLRDITEIRHKQRDILERYENRFEPSWKRTES